MTQEDATRQRVQQVLREFKGHKGALLVSLLHVQYELGYIPETTVKDAAEILGFSEPEVWGVLTFYADFKIGKQGDHFIDVCIDGPCHVAGAPRIKRALEDWAGTKEGSPVQVRSLSCPGMCSKAPVMAVDMTFHGDLTPEGAVEKARAATS